MHKNELIESKQQATRTSNTVFAAALEFMLVVTRKHLQLTTSQSVEDKT